MNNSYALADMSFENFNQATQQNQDARFVESWGVTSCNGTSAVLTAVTLKMTIFWGIME